MKTVIIIQARLGSSRLPGKMLLQLGNLPVIDWVVHRCKQSKCADDVVVAVPNTWQDSLLAQHLQNQRIRVFRGSENDVLARMIAAAESVQADAVVRVCADNPFISGAEIDNLIAFFMQKQCDYAYNHIPRNNLYPDGLGAEIVPFALFKDSGSKAVLQKHREHCMSWFVDNPDLFSICTFDPPDTELHHPELKLDIDTLDDFIHLSMLDVHPDSSDREIVHAAMEFFLQKNYTLQE